MILEIPATILQLTGVVANLFPVWYSLCRMGVSVFAVVIAGWMFYSLPIVIYRNVAESSGSVLPLLSATFR